MKFRENSHQNKIIEIEPESQKDYIRRARAKWLADDYQGAILDYDQVAIQGKLLAVWRKI